MKSYRQDTQERIISEQAASWLCELADGGTEQSAAFVAWLKSSPQHVSEFLLASAAWKTFERIKPVNPAELDAAVAAALAADAATNVVPLSTEAPKAAAVVNRHSSKHNPSRRWIGTIAATVLLTFGVLGTAQWVGWNSDIYSTAVGEQRSFRLPDGSLLNLNTQSRVKVLFSEHSRDIRLLKGEALFTVQRDPTRPFRVAADGALIQAIGTQFNVYRRNHDTTVSVIEGAVQISTKNRPNSSVPTAAPVLLQLKAGEQARIKTGSTAVKQAKSDITKTITWRERRLVFEDDRLEDIATEVNRYTSQRIRVEGTARNKRITGTFGVDDPQALILFLSKEEDLVMNREADEIVILRFQ